MTREEAITIIDNLHLIGCGRNQHENDLKINIAIDMAIEALSVANLKEEFESADAVQAEWTPCSEGLPKKGEVVLITNGKGNVRCGQYRSEYDVRDETHYWWWKGKTVETVLAWMPLPKPYKGGDDKGGDDE